MPLASRIPYPLPQLAHFVRHRNQYGFQGPYVEVVKNELAYYSRWHAAVLRERFTHPGPKLPPVTFVVLSYKRVLNMRAIVSGLLALDCAARVVVVNNNPAVVLDGYLPRDPRVEIVPGTGAIGYRYSLAAELGDARYAFVDDDIFVMPATWHRLLEEFDRDPSVPVGLLGAFMIEEGDGAYHPSLPVFGADFGTDNAQTFVQVTSRGVVDQLAALYVVSLDHVKRLVALSASMGIDMANFSISDDIFLAMSGSSQPRIIGSSHGTDWSFCLSASKKGVAISQSGEAYFRERRETFREVQKRAGIVDTDEIRARRAEVVRITNVAPRSA